MMSEVLLFKFSIKSSKRCLNFGDAIYCSDYLGFQSRNRNQNIKDSKLLKSITKPFFCTDIDAISYMQVEKKMEKSEISTGVA